MLREWWSPRLLPPPPSSTPRSSGRSSPPPPPPPPPRLLAGLRGTAGLTWTKLVTADLNTKRWIVKLFVQTRSVLLYILPPLCLKTPVYTEEEETVLFIKHDFLFPNIALFVSNFPPFSLQQHHIHNFTLQPHMRQFSKFKAQLYGNDLYAHPECKNTAFKPSSTLNKDPYTHSYPSIHNLHWDD